MKYKKLNLINSKQSSEDTVTIEETRLLDGVRDRLELRCSHEFANKAYWLDDEYDWIIGEDSNHVLCIVPLKKEA